MARLTAGGLKLTRQHRHAHLLGPRTLLNLLGLFMIMNELDRICLLRATVLCGALDLPTWGG